MLRKLLIVFASGVILSIVAFGAAWVAGGEKLHKDFAKGDGWSWTIGEENHGPTRNRAFAVAPGTQLAMEIPVGLTFTRGEKAEMVVSGPASLVDRLIWRNGRLSLPGNTHMRHGLKVRITAPEITGLDLDAPGDVTLTGLQQDRFTLNSHGPIDLDAQGKVRQLFITVTGPGDIDLGKVEGEDATVRLDGVGDVTLGATGLVDVEINGVGNVTLLRKPQSLRSSIHGLGSIDHDY
ncbi:Putative auto-transporter adhesin, head GIN domain [Novosphingobium sp. CF614]|uniref:GIN domain-containing protein n=1 Tax=Novosphingobium sp. CF614 TaxID=1884364 RepID=UPI0008EEF52F|nr:DUF2807 domain-containing protein [Novosphingobium sp. CF614]SFG23054.1 Putative auto-transporter adhesin, head GIN domain [Novosphingobium sp. CF614]